MDLTQLRTFVAVAQERHLTRAAERLHISQPAASAHVRALEEDLQVKLFERGNRNLELTENGRRLLRKAQAVLDASLELSSLARSLRKEVTGTVSFSTNSDPAGSRVGALVLKFRERYPLVDLNVELRSSITTLNGVRNGELDAGFLLRNSVDVGLEHLVLQSVKFLIAGPRAWADQIEKGDWKALARLPWIVTPPGTSNNDMLMEFFGTRGLEPEKIVEANNDLLIRSLVAEGVGMALVREDHARRAQRRGSMAICPLGTGHTKLMFVYPQERRADPLLNALVETVRTVWPEARVAAE
jgi:DNA-binding transcriptional LysR family regulator